MFYTRRSTHKRTLHILRWTSAVCLQVAGCRSRSRGRALFRSRCFAGRVRVRPASLKGRRSRTKGRVNFLVKIWRSTWNTYLVWRVNAGMSIWCYGAKMSATRIFLAPVRKKPAPEIRLGSAPPASSVGKARPPYFTVLGYTRVYYYPKNINHNFY